MCSCDKSSSDSTTTWDVGHEQDDIEAAGCSCNRPFMDSKRMECRRCSDMYCIRCIKMTATEYKSLNRSDIMWLCTDCREPAEKSIRSDRSIELRCQESMQEFKDKISEIEKNIDSKCDEDRVVWEILKEELSRPQVITASTEAETTIRNGERRPAKAPEAINTVMSEINERKRREKNIVVYGISENKSAVAAERKTSDIEEAKKIFAACTVDLRDVPQIKRLERYKEPQ